MPSDATNPVSALSRRAALILAGVLLVVELGLIGITYKHGIEFNCLQNWPAAACGGASGVLVAVYALLAALALFFLLKPAPLRELVSEAGHRWRPLGVNILGLVLSMVPVTFLADGTGGSLLLPTLVFWILGFSMLIAGILVFVAPLPRWRRLFQTEKGPLVGICLAGLAAPTLATFIRPLWHVDTIADATFQAVAWLIAFAGYDVEIYPVDKVIGQGDFFISVAPVCSGIEGIALVTVFVTLYLALFRHELRFPRVLLLYPIGIAVSSMLNIVRITALLMIGLEGSPELAVGGFHSHAGWLMFTLIALGIVYAARAVPALQKQTAPSEVAERIALPPLTQDPNAARIVPFAVFMFSALLAQALAQSPGLVYPLRALAMTCGLALFWQVYAKLSWRPSVLSILAGAAIGVMWVAVPYDPADVSHAHGGLVGGALVFWLIVRGLGTILLVPIIEELFFRDYLETKLRSLGGAIIAALVTAGLFALLHDRWIEAFVAGLVFSYVMAQRRQLVDAIASHAVANAIVFAAALAMNKLHII